MWIAHRPHGPRVDRYFQTGAAVLCDAPSPIEVATARRIDTSMTAEVLVAAVANLPFPVQLLAGLLQDPGVPGETISLALVALWPPLEATGSVAPVIANQYGTLEWIGNLQEDNFVSGEVLFSLVAEGGPPSEWLTTGAVVMPDGDLMLEVDGVASTIVVSIESGPTRVRLLASPGRIRLLRRN
jgi:hypothetical protein